LIAGDAAQMVNASHREGSNLAMTAGRLAGETVIEAKKKGDFSAATLSAYQTKLRNSFIIPDLFDHKDLETMVEKHMEIVARAGAYGPGLLDYFRWTGAETGRAKSDLQRVMRNPAVKELIKSELTLKNEYNLMKWGSRCAFFSGN
jgi:flavin-dependent dehydrogenase